MKTKLKRNTSPGWQRTEDLRKNKFFILKPIVGIIRKRFCIAALLILVQGILLSQDFTPKVSILTCSPGNEIYSIYGHNALRLQYNDGRDYVFNYGTFDFQTPNFTLKFIRGKLPYRLSVNYFPQFLEEYKYTRRSVTEQELALDSFQIAALTASLEENMKPENREYLYDFFLDNCATRVYQIIQQATGGSIHWNTRAQGQNTFRTRIKEYQKHLAWTDFGIDIIIGSGADKPISIQQDMFLPDYVKHHFQDATLNQRSLIRKEEKILQFNASKEVGFVGKLVSPLSVFLILLVLELYLFFTAKKRTNVKILDYYDKTWFILWFLVGLLILFMWFFTNHAPVKNNFNVLWTVPSIFFLLGSSRKSSIRYLVWVLLGMCSIQAFGMEWLPQWFNIVFGIICVISILKWWRNINFLTEN